MMSEKFLIIDCDGTLVNTSTDILNAVNHSLALHDLSLFTLSEVLEYIGSGVYPLLRQRAGEELFQDVLDEFRNFYSANLVVTSHIYEGWERVFEKTGPEQTVILSNKPQEFLDIMAQELGFSGISSAWFGREAFSEHKPSAVPVNMILKKFQVHADDAVIIGDMPADILSGKSAGIATVGALYGYSSSESLRQYDPDAIINHPVELLDVLEKLDTR
jgi:phosphoglycolate phosphatase